MRTEKRKGLGSRKTQASMSVNISCRYPFTTPTSIPNPPGAVLQVAVCKDDTLSGKCGLNNAIKDFMSSWAENSDEKITRYQLEGAFPHSEGVRLEVTELEEGWELAVDAVQTFQENSVRGGRKRQDTWRWRVDHKWAQLKQVSKQPCADGRGSLAITVARCCWRATFVVAFLQSTRSSNNRFGLPAPTIWNIHKYAQSWNVDTLDTMALEVLFDIKLKIELKVFRIRIEFS